MTKRTRTVEKTIAVAWVIGVGLLLFGFLAGCGLPITKEGFQQQAAHALGPFHSRLDALDRKVVALEQTTTANFVVVDENFQTLAAGIWQATKRAEAAKSLGETTVKLLGSIGRNAAVASKEATAGRKKAEAASQKIAEAQKALGEKIDTAAATTGAAVAGVGRKIDTAAAAAATAHVALDQKVDRRVDEVVGAVKGIDIKVDATKTAAETGASRAGAARDLAEKAAIEAELAKTGAQMAGVKADAAGTRAEAAAQVAGSKADAAGAKADTAGAKAEAAGTKAEAAGVKADTAGSKAEAVAMDARAKIIAELNRLITRPLP